MPSTEAGPDQPLHSSYFTRRLENFSDLVFAFSLSLLALQLEIPKDGETLNPWHVAYFFVTFAVVAGVWFMHYRMFRYAFAAQGPDVVLNFALLACVAFLPYTLQLLIHREGGLPILLYELDFGTLYLLFAVLNLRGLIHWNVRLPDDVRGQLWRRSVAGTIVALTAYAAASMVPALGSGGTWTFLLLFFLRPVLQLRPFREPPRRLAAGTSGA